MHWGLGNLSSDDLLRHLTIKSSYIWTASHAYNYNRIDYGQRHVQSEIIYIASTCQLKAINHKRGTPFSSPLSPSFSFGVLGFFSWVQLCLWEYITLSINLCFAGYFCAFCPNLNSTRQEPETLTTNRCSGSPFPLDSISMIEDQNKLIKVIFTTDKSTVENEWNYVQIG
jgi:hypothetical protein